ncbi:hypothetical protein [Peribacillus deserti]|uniref:Uncharacterized protein n=1 Tax=Peribacillus deserti TaxID=673318 RepID=A0A2N5M247_9BACI|nr:hypothetical protein [Peribacillus deserti]PLT28438.1 hypothetical protein CUU66_18525 [Peribacillus deserti]
MSTETAYRINENLMISEKILKCWDAIFVPDYDFFYFETINQINKVFPGDVLIYSKEELINDHVLCNIDNRCAFKTWNVNSIAKFAAIVPNSHFSILADAQKAEILYEQWRLRRGLIWEYEWIKAILKKAGTMLGDICLTIFEENAFETPEGKMAAIQRTLWDRIPFSVKTLFFTEIAKSESDSISLWSQLSIKEKNRIENTFPHIFNHLHSFAEKNGPNCLAAAIAGATVNKDWTDWISNQWLQSKETFPLLLAQGAIARY